MRQKGKKSTKTIPFHTNWCYSFLMIILVLWIAGIWLACSTGMIPLLVVGFVGYKILEACAKHNSTSEEQSTGDGSNPAGQPEER